MNACSMQAGTAAWGRGPRTPPRGVVIAGIVMMLQPFAMALYTWSFVTMLAGTAMFIVVSKFPE